MSIPMCEPKSISDLTNKIALITGASSGLGAAMAQAYVAAGAYVVNADITPNPPKIAPSTTPVHELVNQQYPVSSGPPRMLYIQTDVADSSSVENAVQFTVKNYGRLDIMINNAAVTAGAGLRSHEATEELYDKAVAINVKGIWLGTRSAVTQMLKQEPHITGDRGWIINTCSIASFIALPNAALYCLCKGAAQQYTRASAFEYATDRIHINSVNPGFVDTALLSETKERMGADAFTEYLTSKHPWGRMGLAEDIAKVCVFMAGSGVSFVTGQPFVVDGGYTLP